MLTHMYAQALLYCAQRVLMPHNREPTQIRVGMHTGGCEWLGLGCYVKTAHKWVRLDSEMVQLCKWV
jgi:hypothetical protein